MDLAAIPSPLPVPKQSREERPLGGRTGVGESRHDQTRGVGSDGTDDDEARSIASSIDADNSIGLEERLALALSCRDEGNKRVSRWYSRRLLQTSV